MSNFEFVFEGVRDCVYNNKICGYLEDCIYYWKFCPYKGEKNTEKIEEAYEIVVCLMKK